MEKTFIQAKNSNLFGAHLLLGDRLYFDTEDSLKHHFLYFRNNSSIVRFSNGFERKPSEGAICYIPPKTSYKIITASQDSSITGIACYGSLADSFAQACGACDTRISLYPIAVEAYNNAEKLCESVLSTSEETNRTALAFYTLFVEMVFAKSHIVESKPALIAHHIKQYIDENLSDEMSVASIAKQFYLSETHVIRIFRDKYGVTPKQYLLRSKIEQSKLMLIDTSLQIKEIAMILHFADSYHFSHTFKRFTGVSPEKFRMREDERRKK